ncbi:MAG: ABC transporter ATP-binding protein [Candidatus Methylarchaceae archaeon HK02M2]|nr:ABC transporter ATP-binding protein [Candidatus Methylarchaceae archaeon HK02M2]
MKLSIQNLYFKYSTTNVLNRVNLEVYENEVVSIVGPNASGKTTLLRCINKVLEPQIGNVFIDGKAIAKMNVKELAKEISCVPQIPLRSFLLTVLDVILMGRTPYIKWQLTKDDLEIAEESIKLVGIENLTSKYFDELSGGEMQRVLISKAITQEPKVLLLDEPTAHLDIKNQLEILDLIRNLAMNKNIAVLMAIHDLNLAARFSDRIYMIKKGSIFASGSPMDILTSENIKEVYGVEVRAIKSEKSVHIIPIKPVGSFD